jgi:hypothetical protein
MEGILAIHEGGYFDAFLEIGYGVWIRIRKLGHNDNGLCSSYL